MKSRKQSVSLLTVKSTHVLGLVLVFSILLAGQVGTARADGVGPNYLQGVAFDQKLDEQVPMDLAFKNEWGETVKLGDLFAGKPVILTLNYFSCPNLCDFELNQLVGSLGDLSFNLGEQYNVVTVSFDPRDKPSLAMDKKKLFTKRYSRPGTEANWHFLTGDQAAIKSLTQAVGFHYAYDAQDDEFAHPTGVIVLTPQGKIARYLYGTDFPSRDLRLALVEAAQGKIGSSVDKVLLFCFHYDPSVGRYSTLALTAVRWSGVATVLGMGIFLGLLWRKDIKRDKKNAS